MSGMRTIGAGRSGRRTVGTVVLVNLVVVTPVVLATILAFDRVDRRAGLLFVPSLAWVTFAALLNYQFWRLN